MKLFQVDAFADRPFAGNPAGVCILSESRPDSWMLNVAREMNLSETAFVTRQSDSYGLRWFTPKIEVPLCGHATLASAHILWEERIQARDTSIRFHTKSGMLQARQAGRRVEMDFPARPVEPVGPNNGINRSLQVTPLRTFNGTYAAKGDLFLLEVESEDVLKIIAPDYPRLQSTAAIAVIVTCRSSRPEYDFVSRFFAPAAGVNEDPVTGAAHCYLAPYWGTKLGKKEMVGYQASDRSGVVYCLWEDDRVWLGGAATTVFKAELLA
jgi:PhzF family phenazine biosynthesis protein